MSRTAYQSLPPLAQDAIRTALLTAVQNHQFKDDTKASHAYGVSNVLLYQWKRLALKGQLHANKRGRHPRTNVINIEANKPIEVIKPIEVTKPRLDRPPLNKPVGEPIVKRRVGRPSLKDSIITIKRKVGRPSLKNLISTIKRRVGRPSKEMPIRA